MAILEGDDGVRPPLKIAVDLPGNSNNARAEEPIRAQRLINSPVTQRKPSAFRKVVEIFFGHDMREVGRGVVNDVIIPALKDMVFESGKEGLARSLYGDSPVRGVGRRNGRVDYGGISKAVGGITKIVGTSAVGSGQTEIPRSVRSQHNFSELYIENRGDAEKALDGLFDLVDTYDLATVADLYEILGIEWNHVDRKWGWTSLRGANIERTYGGYRLVLPKPVEVK